MTDEPTTVRVTDETLDRVVKSPSTFAAWVLRAVATELQSLRAREAELELDRDARIEVNRILRESLDATQDRVAELERERDGYYEEWRQASRAGATAAANEGKAKAREATLREALSGMFAAPGPASILAARAALASTDQTGATQVLVYGATWDPEATP